MTTKISAAIVKAQAEIRSAQKSGDNKFDKYAYSKLEDFFASAKPAMAANGLALIVSVKSYESLPDRSTKNGGTEHAVRVMLEGALIHESGETLIITGCGEGQDRADKALYKAITGGKKYLLASLFSIPTTDDPEADETVGLSTKGAEAPKKLNSQGEVVNKIPAWTPEQQAEIGAMFKEIYDIGGKAGEDDVSNFRKLHKRDDPTTTIDAAALMLRHWQDIYSQTPTTEGPVL